MSLEFVGGFNIFTVSEKIGINALNEISVPYPALPDGVRAFWQATGNVRGTCPNQQPTIRLSDYSISDSINKLNKRKRMLTITRSINVFNSVCSIVNRIIFTHFIVVTRLGFMHSWWSKDVWLRFLYRPDLFRKQVIGTENCPLSVQTNNEIVNWYKPAQMQTETNISWSW